MLVDILPVLLVSYKFCLRLAAEFDSTERWTAGCGSSDSERLELAALLEHNSHCMPCCGRTGSKGLDFGSALELKSLDSAEQERPFEPQSLLTLELPEQVEVRVQQPDSFQMHMWLTDTVPLHIHALVQPIGLVPEFWPEHYAGVRNDMSCNRNQTKRLGRDELYSKGRET